jgi:Raf kinase inhibitor-like YbhB/YbcL family protein
MPEKSFFGARKEIFMSLKAWSSSLTPGRTVPENYIFNGMGCSGQNISPPIEWKDAPANTRSFAVTVFDPDAPQAGGWWHWAVVNIPPEVHLLPEGASTNDALPEGAVEVETDFGIKHYGGPCPPKGDRPHHYIFTVYALKNRQVQVTPNSTPASIKKLLEQDYLDKASFTVEYGRK